MKWIVTLAVVGTAATAALAASTGCGGGGGGSSSDGGGGGGTSTGGTTSGGTGSSYYFSGTLTDSSGNAIVGDTVEFDGNSSYKSVTSSSGAFDVTGVPASALTGSDYLTVIDANGDAVTTYTLGEVTKSVSGIAISTGPPAPPTSLTKKR